MFVKITYIAKERRHAWGWQLEIRRKEIPIRSETFHCHGRIMVVIIILEQPSVQSKLDDTYTWNATTVQH